MASCKTLGYVHSLESFGSVDGPGVRFVVFLQGCALRCKYCHNPETWAEGGEEWTAEALFQRVYRYRNYWGKKGGITVSGGEPLRQLDFLTEFFTLARAKGVHTALDTAGQPFRPEEEDFLFMLLRLRSRGECAVMEGALRGAQRELVKPEIENLLMILGETGQAHIARPGLEDLVFEIHIAMYDEICETLSRCVREGTGAAQAFREAVEAARFLWERVLDMDYGSMEIVKLDEMLPVAERLVQRLRTL